MDFARYLSIPYEVGGMTFEGADCYGLVSLILYYELGIDIAKKIHYKATDDYQGIHQQSHEAFSDFKIIKDINKLQANDIIVFKILGKYYSHIGFYLGTMFIHTRSECGVVVDNLFLTGWKHKFGLGLRYENKS